MRRDDIADMLEQMCTIGCVMPTTPICVTCNAANYIRWLREQGDPHGLKREADTMRMDTILAGHPFNLRVYTTNGGGKGLAVIHYRPMRCREDIDEVIEERRLRAARRGEGGGDVA